MISGRVQVMYKRQIHVKCRKMGEEERLMGKTVVVSGASVEEARECAVVEAMRVMPPDWMKDVVRVVGYTADGTAVAEYRINL